MRDLPAFLLVLGYGVTVGILAQRKGIPRELANRAQQFLDDQTRRQARIASQEMHRELSGKI